MRVPSLIRKCWKGCMTVLRGGNPIPFQRRVCCKMSWIDTLEEEESSPFKEVLPDEDPFQAPAREVVQLLNLGEEKDSGDEVREERVIPSSKSSPKVTSTQSSSGKDK